MKKQLEGRDKIIDDLRNKNDSQMEEKLDLEKKVQKKTSKIDKKNDKIQSLK